MELKNRIWMNGNLEWYAYLGENEVFLGGREVPYPLSEGDTWTNAYGDVFQVVDGEIVPLERVEPPLRFW
jgi:hypothetical protein